MSVRIRIPNPFAERRYQEEYDDQYEDDDYVDINEKMTFHELGYVILRNIVALLLGFVFACITLVVLVPKIPLVSCVTDVNDPDWGADFPEHTLCYITSDIPVISDSVEFGQYIAYQDGADITVAVVMAISDEGDYTVADAQGNETEIKSSQCLGVVTFTIPWLGRFIDAEVH